MALSLPKLADYELGAPIGALFAPDPRVLVPLAIGTETRTAITVVREPSSTAFRIVSFGRSGFAREVVALRAKRASAALVRRGWPAV